MHDKPLKAYMDRETYMELMEYCGSKELTSVLKPLSSWDQWKLINEKQVHNILKLIGPK